MKPRTNAGIPLAEALRGWLLDQSQQAHYAADHPDGQPGDPGGYFDKGAAHMADAALTQLATVLESAAIEREAQAIPLTDDPVALAVMTSMDNPEECHARVGEGWSCNQPKGHGGLHGVVYSG